MTSLSIGGRPVETLACEAPLNPTAPAFIRAEVAPARGMMLLQARVRLPGGGETDLLHCPPLDQLPGILDGGEEDFAGNKSFAFGAALLVPFANRIRGHPADGRRLKAEVHGRPVLLPQNWGGRQPGAEQYAMHGLMLARAPDQLERKTSSRGETLTAAFNAGDFDGQWLSKTRLIVELSLEAGALSLKVRASNVGEALLPIGIGWHPYFALPSGRRDQARVHLPARARLEVNNYDEVLPTGRTLPVGGTPYDFRAPGGAELGDLYLDDCFVGFDRGPGGEIAAVITDPAAHYGLKVRSLSREVSGVQIFAPPQNPYVVLEPQFNWADPFGPEWGGQDTGMVTLRPGAAVSYEVRIEPFAIPVEPSRRRRRR